MDTTELEESVLETIAQGDTKDADALRAQIRCARVKRREYTGVGFFTYFEVSGETLRLSDDYRSNLSEAVASHPDVPAGAGFLLWAEQGKLSCLEGYVFEGLWPENDAKFSVSAPNLS